MKTKQLFSVFFIFIGGVFAAYNEPHFVENRTTIIHLFEWKWSDIAKECEQFLGPKGFAGVQVSPVNEHIIINSPSRPWWERYQPVSYQISTRSGNVRSFVDMVERCNRAGIRIYVDVVFNHMTGNNSESTGTAGSLADYENMDYPGVPYEKSDFNEPCDITDSSDPVMIRNCQLYGLRDLNQKSSWVKFNVVNFLNTLINMGVAGFRIDAAMYMWPADLEQIYNMLNNLNTAYGFKENARPFIYQEVVDLGLSSISRDEYTLAGAITEYKAGILLGSTFRGVVPLENLRYWGESSGLVSSNYGITFLENHDNQRGHGVGSDTVLTYKQPYLYKAAIAFMLAHPYGNVRLMSSYDFTDSDAGPPTDSDGTILSPLDESGENCRSEWVCEHRWGAIQRMVQFRNYVQGSDIKVTSYSGATIGFERTGKGVFFSLNTPSSFGYSFPTTMPLGQYCDLISGEKVMNQCTGKTITVGDFNYIEIKFDNNDKEFAIAIHTGPESML